MSYKTDINFNKLISWHIPQEVSRFKLLALAQALCYAVVRLYVDVFNKFHKDIEKELSITPQIWSLEKHLNDKYDKSIRRIFIEDGKLFPLQVLYTRAEQKPLHLHTRAEATPVYMGLRSESGFSTASFYVRVPSGLIPQKEEIKAFVNRHKLASKSFEIVEI